MGRAQKQVRLKGGSANVERKPTALGSGKGNGVQKRTGLERPDAASTSPKNTDLQARINKTNS